MIWATTPEVTMRIGIYGGAFNPPHVGHLKVMIHALAMGRLNRIHVVPTWKHAFGKDMVDFDDRIEMVAKLIRPYRKNIVVHDYERRFQTTYTIDLIEKLLVEEHLNRPFSWSQPDTYVLIIGQDNMDIAHKWHRWDELVKMVEIMVVPECGHERSTLVREAYADRDEVTVKKMVPPTVRAYIKKRKLYI